MGLEITLSFPMKMKSTFVATHPSRHPAMFSQQRRKWTNGKEGRSAG